MVLRFLLFLVYFLQGNYWNEKINDMSEVFSIPDHNRFPFSFRVTAMPLSGIFTLLFSLSNEISGCFKTRTRFGLWQGCYFSKDILIPKWKGKRHKNNTIQNKHHSSCTMYIHIPLKENAFLLLELADIPNWLQPWVTKKRIQQIPRTKLKLFSIIKTFCFCLFLNKLISIVVFACSIKKNIHVNICYFLHINIHFSHSPFFSAIFFAGFLGFWLCFS